MATNEPTPVGWWHWWDGDTAKCGQFRYDHPDYGVSVLVFMVVVAGHDNYLAEPYAKEHRTSTTAQRLNHRTVRYSRCSCGWVGPARTSTVSAERDARDHLDEGTKCDDGGFSWSDVEVHYPEFVHWVVASYGPLPESVTEEDWNRFKDAYEAAPPAEVSS